MSGVHVRTWHDGGRLSRGSSVRAEHELEEGDNVADMWVRSSVKPSGREEGPAMRWKTRPPVGPLWESRPRGERERGKINSFSIFLTHFQI